MWVVGRAAFPSIVDAGLFEYARVIVENRSRCYEDVELLALLSDLL